MVRKFTIQTFSFYKSRIGHLHFSKHLSLIKAIKQVSVLCLIITLNIITDPATSAIRNSRPLHKRTSYSHGQGHSHNHIKYDNAYFYDYRIHGADNKHHGEDQYFGQSEYRNDNKVSKFFFRIVYRQAKILIILIYAYFLIMIRFFPGFWQVLCPTTRWPSTDSNVYSRWSVRVCCASILHPSFS